MIHQKVWFVPAVVFLVCWTLTTHGKFSVSGDEPHYLMVSESLWADGDLDVRNNYAAGDSRRFGLDELETALHVRETRDGRLFPVHDVGVPVALLPVYGAATTVSQLVPESLLRRFRMSQGLFAYSLISVFIIGMTAVAAAVVRAAVVASGTRSGVASTVVLAAWLSPPVLSNSFLVFPECAALLVTAWAVRLAVTSGVRAPSRLSALAFVTATGALPWFHRKYAIYGLALLIVVAWRHRARLAGVNTSGRAVALALFLLPQSALTLWTWHHWGNLGGPLTIDGVPLAWSAFQTGWLGLLVDRENGLFVWAPIYLLLPAAWMLAGREHWLWLFPVASLFLPSAAHHQWWGGFSPAARFLVPLVPMFCLIGSTLAKDRVLKAVSVALLVPQLLISAYGWQTPRALWPRGDGHNRVIGGLLPSFPNMEEVLPSVRLSPAGIPRAATVILFVAAANVAGVQTVRWRRRRLASGCGAR